MIKKGEKYFMLTTIDKVRLVTGWLIKKKAQDILALDVSTFTIACEAIILATAQSASHGQALADWILERAHTDRLECFGMEGYRSGRWVLVDLNDVIVHIFQSEVRVFYNLEGLWSRAVHLALDHVHTSMSPSLLKSF
ncbi:ribosome-associated protein [Desulfovibrionales bacterium]